MAFMDRNKNFMPIKITFPVSFDTKGDMTDGSNQKVTTVLEELNIEEITESGNKIAYVAHGT